MKSRNLWIAIVAIVIVLAAGFGLAAKNNSPAASNAAQVTSQDVSYPCTSGRTALAALSAAYTVETKDTSFGKQVMGINGVAAADKQFWAFYIDGTSATVGADAYQCQGTETISWKLESF